MKTPNKPAELEKAKIYCKGKEQGHKEGRERGIKEGKEIRDIELMKDGKFHTSMNRKVCYDEGKAQALTEVMRIIDDFDFEKWNHKDNEYSYFGLECKGELKARLKIL